MTLTRAEIVRALKHDLKLPSAEAEEFLEDLLDQMARSLQREGRLKLARFGSFEVRFKKPRLARNLRTQEKVWVSARNVVGFYPSDFFKEQLNLKGQSNTFSSRDKKIKKGQEEGFSCP